MSRYRKIEVRTWMDEKFRGLSAMPPSGQGLWLFLMTGPHTGPIPGLFRAGRAGMAEELGWDVEAFDEAFAEVSTQGMAKADFKARLVWLPNAVKHNKPESPNVVRSWRVELDLLPECDLKREAIAAIRKHLSSLESQSFVEAFDEFASGSADAPAKPSGKPSRKASPNQEQEQEQQQEQEGKPSDADASGGMTPPSSRPIADLRDQVFATGVLLLTEAGVAEKHARSFLAAQCKGGKEQQVLQALQLCAEQRPGQPVPWLVEILKGERTAPTHNRQEALEQRNRAVADAWATQGAVHETH